MTSTIKEKSAIINVKSEKNVRNKAYFKRQTCEISEKIAFYTEKDGGWRELT